MADARIIARGRRDLLGEGLYWSARDGALLWTDIIGQRINRLVPETGHVDSWETGAPTGWIVARESGGFVAGIGLEIAAVTLDPFSCEAIATLPGDPATHRVNDAIADASGRLWLGTMPRGCDTPSGAFHRLENGRIGPASTDAYTIPNGPALDPGGRFLLHTDSAAGVIYRHALHDGALAAREVFIRFEDDWGSPDGMCFDADGFLWVACWDASRVTRFAPDGTPVSHIELPASQISNCCFGGKALDRLYVTSASDGTDEADAGALFEIDAGVTGIAPFPYRG